MGKGGPRYSLKNSKGNKIRNTLILLIVVIINIAKKTRERQRFQVVTVLSRSCNHIEIKESTSTYIGKIGNLLKEKGQ